MDVNDEKVSAEAERDDELKRIRTEALTTAQDKEVQNMLIQEKYDRMDWLTYGKEQKNEGDRQRMEEDAKGMYAEGIKPDVIARVQKVFVDVIEKILGLQPVWLFSFPQKTWLDVKWQKKKRGCIRGCMKKGDVISSFNYKSSLGNPKVPSYRSF